MRSVRSAYQRLQTLNMMEAVPATLRTALSTRTRNLCSDSVATKLTRWHVGGPRADKALADGTNTHKNTRKRRVLTRRWLMVRKHIYIHTRVLPLVTDTPAHICTNIHTHSHAHSLARARALSLSHRLAGYWDGFYKHHEAATPGSTYDWYSTNDAFMCEVLK